MTRSECIDWKDLEMHLDSLFTSDCDPYQAGAAVLLSKSAKEVTQDEREVVKLVFMRILLRRSEKEQTLRRAADMFHEIGSAISSENLLGKPRVNAVIAEKLRGNVRSREELQKIAADGFELCVRALAEMGAKDVTFRECAEKDMEER